MVTRDLRSLNKDHSRDKDMKHIENAIRHVRAWFINHFTPFFYRTKRLIQILPFENDVNIFLSSYHVEFLFVILRNMTKT